jgi:hypothetical protein
MFEEIMRQRTEEGGERENERENEREEVRSDVSVVMIMDNLLIISSSTPSQGIWHHVELYYRS